MKYQDGQNDQHTSFLDWKIYQNSTSKGWEKTEYENIFLKKNLQIAIKIRNKCPLGINV